MHVSRNDLEPGDLVFFFSDISHVGMYIGNGMMIDAPNFGEDVKVEPISGTSSWAPSGLPEPALEVSLSSH